MHKNNYKKRIVKLFKRSFDIIFSIFALLVLIPYCVPLMILIFIDLGLPIFYCQERVGKNFKPFQIIKFRSMKSFKEEPKLQLEIDNDTRLTNLGRWMRKYRLDEIPQFWNVIKGEMSLVGPRPERKIYVNKLLDQVDDYDILFTLKPGLTSKGIVEFGYASNMEDMKQRAVYDIEYCSNPGLTKDLIIGIKSISIILKGKGK